MLPPLNALRAFEAVARHQSFQKAAEELSVTSSAVSHQLRNLEDFMNADLLERNSKKFGLTPEGQILFDYLSQAFSLIRQGAADVAARTTASPLGVSLRSHFAARWLGPRMSRLWRKLPGLDVRFFHHNGPADFGNPNIHVAIEWLHVSEVPTHARLLWPGDLSPACSPDILKGEMTVTKPSDLAKHKLLHENDERSWQEWLTAAGEPNLWAGGKLFFEDSNVRHSAAIAGEGFALVCPSLIEDDLNSGQLVCPFDARLDSYAYYIIAPANRMKIPAVKKFVTWILNEAGRAP
ncbi:LysR substrate-binding domain-containing protein [Pelagibius sp. Alg239-R121]|uniref:LysR substrate-binding domain-containing protein n=1 Tax=Pelagibius sp. Alg239-R121 TaxID=2993448 RepID=UPI0024A716EB|nr:LysR substrate-binding domain-containing protein [Pelagibius sp. Alg239-R121]